LAAGSMARAAPAPGDARELAAAALFVLHGANAVRLDFAQSFTGVCKDWPAFPYRFVYLTVQCNILVLAFGLGWLAEVCRPGCTQGLVDLSTHLACGLAVYVFVNYYALVHFHSAALKEAEESAAKGELLFRNRPISVVSFYRLMHWIHAPLLPLAGLPLVTMNRTELAAGMLGTVGTLMFALLYGAFYASLVLLLKRVKDVWVYPFMDDFSLVWHHAVFYAVSFGLYAMFCLGYRGCVLRARGHEPLEEGLIGLICAAILVVMALDDRRLKGVRARDTGGDGGYKPLRGDGGA